MVARHVRGLPEDRRVRAPDTLEDVEDGQDHRDDDALEDADERDPEEAQDREDELGLPDPPEPAQLGEVEEADRRGDDDGREDRLGIDWTSPGTKTSIARTSAAATIPASCVFAPDWTATAVRDPLELTGKPEKNPTATFAEPMPASSWFVITSYPPLLAKAPDVEIVSPIATSEMPTAEP